MGNTLAIHNIKFCLLKGRRYFIFTTLQRVRLPMTSEPTLSCSTRRTPSAPRSKTSRGTATGSNLRITIDHADLFTQLVDKDGHAVGFGDDTGQLQQGLGISLA